MKTLKLLTLLTLTVCFTSCSDNDGSTLFETEAKTITNLQATQTADYTTNPPTITGDYIKFSFETGEVTTGDNWDVAFRGTTILVNGGSTTANDQPERTGNAKIYIATGSLAEITDVNVASFVQDDTTNGLAIKTGSGNGWYNYNPTTHIISPIAGKVLVVQTNGGKYAKFEVLSYYKDSDTSNDSQHYSFNYVYQPNEGVTTF